jgi:hypothetical protein
VSLGDQVNIESGQPYGNKLLIWAAASCGTDGWLSISLLIPGWAN